MKFDLDLDQINLDRYLPPPGDQPAAQKSAAKDKSSAEKPDYKPLRRMILDGTAKIGQLTVSNARVQDVLLQIKAKDGISSSDPITRRAMAGRKASGAATGDRLTRTAPSGKAWATWWASSMARRVLPLPPGPTRVSKRQEALFSCT